jgi:hypothetical protein
MSRGNTSSSCRQPDASHGAAPMQHSRAGTEQSRNLPCPAEPQRSRTNTDTRARAPVSSATSTTPAAAHAERTSRLPASWSSWSPPTTPLRVTSCTARNTPAIPRSPHAPAFLAGERSLRLFANAEVAALARRGRSHLDRLPDNRLRRELMIGILKIDVFSAAGPGMRPLPLASPGGGRQELSRLRAERGGVALFPARPTARGYGLREEALEFAIAICEYEAPDAASVTSVQREAEAKFDRVLRVGGWSAHPNGEIAMFDWRDQA